MRWLLLSFAAFFLVGGCTDSMEPVRAKFRPKKKRKDAAPKDTPPPPTCHLLLPGLNLSDIYGLGAFHREKPAPGRRFLFDCEWRVDRAGTARRTIVYQAACGDQARAFRRMHGRKGPADTEVTVRAGMGGVAQESHGLTGEATVRLLFESAAMPGCFVSIRAPGSAQLAARVARAIEESLVRRSAP